VSLDGTIYEATSGGGFIDPGVEVGLWMLVRQRRSTVSTVATELVDKAFSAVDDHARGAVLARGLPRYDVNRAG